MDFDCPGFEGAGFVSAGVPGIRGEIRVEPGDFLVEEIPLYPPSGSGEHVYARIRKTGISTFGAIRRIAGALHLRDDAIGYAGMKDTSAVAIQHFSIAGASCKAVAALSLQNVEILEVAPHGSKIRVGHLKGNRFGIRLRGAGAGALPDAKAALDVLAARGVPNAYMGQRFGRHCNTHELGRAVLLNDGAELTRLMTTFDQSDGPEGLEAAEAVRAGDFGRAFRALGPGFVVQKAVLSALAAGSSFEKAARVVQRREKQLYLSAFQSYLFNRVLARRMPDIDTLETGDLAVKHRNGAFFTVKDARAELPRAASFEISASAPVFGYMAPLCEGKWGAVEREIMEAADAGPERWKLGGGLSQKGERRPVRFQLVEPSVSADGDDLLFSFSIQKGAYATAVFREIFKS